MKSVILLSILVLSLNSFAGEVGKGTSGAASSSKGPSTEASVELGGCKPQVDPKTKTEEAFARNEAEKAGLSKEELLARLIYSESISTGYWKQKCNANSEDDIMQSIGWGIMNRVKGKATASLDAYSDVIFDKDQFRTSFSGKKKAGNPFAEAFLCPLKSQAHLGDNAVAKELYRKSQAIATNIVDEYEKKGLPKEYKHITNFFYPHSEFFGEMRPKWAPNSDLTKNRGYMNILKVTDKPCVEFYNL